MSRLSTPEARQAALRSSAWFAGLGAELQQWIAQTARPRALVAGQRLFGRGDLPDGLYFVVDGAIRMTNTSADGRQALLAIAESPQWFGEVALFDPQPHMHDAWIDTDTLLLQIRHPELHAFLAAHPAHWQAFGQLIAQKLRLAFQAIEGTVLLPAPLRLAQRLLAIAGGYGARSDGSKRVIRVQQDQLGAMLSISRQTVNQILKDLEGRGLLHCARGSIEITDFAGLRRFAGSV